MTVIAILITIVIIQLVILATFRRSFKRGIEKGRDQILEENLIRTTLAKGDCNQDVINIVNQLVVDESNVTSMRAEVKSNREDT